ncbi:MAG: tRNA glutamyl-Q(34) synthetase GluQRS [Bifidobacteriaceae bacterium]|nr:tRNA glutamyl-Q(34) synthetase GluQRS [Bifidobacteriaceae bacterium]
MGATGAGRFAPSPSGELHLGNLRTALLAWLFARTSGRRFLLRIEDLDDRSRPHHERRQIEDLAAIGLDFDGPAVRQSERRAAYTDAVDSLRRRDLVYPCFCTRQEIRDAPRAPHAPPGAYPGTCRNLSAATQARRCRDKPPAWRLRTDGGEQGYDDALLGHVAGVLDDFVLLRGDGVPAYNLAVVVDDGQMGIDQVVRGDDLASSTPRQRHLAELLGYAVPEYAHVPLALNAAGARLAKRDGAVTLSQLVGDGIGGEMVLGVLAQSLGLAEPGEAVSLAQLASRFDPARLPRQPWVVQPAELFGAQGRLGGLCAEHPGGFVEHLDG